ncbi:hypothetical protein NKDENANG_03290 [Candidatus Entotheonellaceae bacterium PAL068K]
MKKIIADFITKVLTTRTGISPANHTVGMLVETDVSLYA